MYCPRDCFDLAPGVRLRPVTEAGVCLAYTAARPALHRLNAAGWLLVSLCDGRSLAAVTEGYQAAMGGRGDAAGLQASLAGFVACGILEHRASGDDATGDHETGDHETGDQKEETA